MLSNVFFDLDGTLTDSKEGIVKCFHYALNKLDHPYPTEFEANDFIGPPIRVSFRKLLCSNDEVLVQEAIALYRKRFSTIGLFENKVYPGIPELLSSLHKKSFKLYVVTSKAKIYADRIIDHFQLSQWFNDIFGSELDKADLIKSILSSLNLPAEETIMIGDKKEDVIAGKANRIKTIGVTYGYGSLREIKDAAPDFICGSPAEIETTIMSMQ